MNNPPEILIPTRSYEELARAIVSHVRSCTEHDHSAWYKQVPLVDFVPAFSSLTCRSCKDREYLKVQPSDDGTLDAYVCSLLIQQQEFFDRHFANCIAAKAV